MPPSLRYVPLVSGLQFEFAFAANKEFSGTLLIPDRPGFAMRHGVQDFPCGGFTDNSEIVWFSVVATANL